MFENILSLWRSKGSLDQALSEFKEMLESSEKMFKQVSQKLIHNQDQSDLRENVYQLDKRINELEKSIRKRVVEHLVLQPTVDVSACLVLMSVVKDAERLGDYCKNLFEVTHFLKQPLDTQRFQEFFNGMDEELSQFFEETQKAFIESDEKVAAHTWEHKAKISQKCDDIIKELAQGTLPTNEAVCLTLIARHFKRLSSHLVNIATSVILPVSELDYFDESRKQGTT